MVCSLQTPSWVLPHRAGLQSATEVPSESVIELTWGQALPTLPLATVFYNIYYGTDLLTLFDTPKNFSLQLSASIPTSLATDGYYFGVKASQLGVAAYFNGLSNMALNATAFAYPAPANLTQPLNTTGIVTRVFLDGYSGFPLRDGYVEIGNEILLYSTVDGYGPSLVISSKNPFGCNDGYASYPIGTDVKVWRGFEEGNSVSFIPTHACILPEPEWGFNAPPGLNAALDLGLGTSVELRWGPAIAPGGAQVFYNVYYNTDFESLFNDPQGIAEEEGNIVVPELDPGTIYYFAVRATYFTNDWDITELTQLSQGFFAYPQGVEVNELDGYYFETEMTPLRVTSTDGFPDAGFILVGSEVMAYSSKTATTFIISDRDIFDFDQLADHANGTDVLLYKGIEDNNTTSFRAVPSWDKRQDSPKMAVPDSGPDYLQDTDGYRSFPTDNLTEDHSISEDENDDRGEYPYCGYRATNFVDLYNRNLCNTYFGGRQDGFGGGIDVAESNLQREELLLASTGEPFVLLKRKWTGKVCRSITHRQEHPDARCPFCFGTGFVGGYDRYIHPRPIRPNDDNINGFIMMRVSPYDDDLDLNPERGLNQVDRLQVWTTALPAIHDRDILIRYIGDRDFNIIGEEFRYIVDFTNRNKLLFGLDGRQQMTIKRLDKTHEAYKVEVELT